MTMRLCPRDRLPCACTYPCTPRPLQQESPLDRIWAESKAAADREQQAKHAREQDVLSKMQQEAQAGSARVVEMLGKYERPETAGAPTNDLKANPSAHTHTPLQGILDARGERYGAFPSNSSIAQGIKDLLVFGDNWREVAYDQREALHQIATKISRIVTGDPDYVDNWDDIAGYAKLVADRLRGL